MTDRLMHFQQPLQRPRAVGIVVSHEGKVSMVFVLHRVALQHVGQLSLQPGVDQLVFGGYLKHDGHFAGAQGLGICLRQTKPMQRAHLHRQSYAVSEAALLLMLADSAVMYPHC